MALTLQIVALCALLHLVFVLGQGIVDDNIPKSCTKWNDGCNSCLVTEGRLGGCTKRMCFRSGPAFCEAYEAHTAQPDGCIDWFDGCNTCSGGGCTEMFCLDWKHARCLKWEGK